MLVRLKQGHPSVPVTVAADYMRLSPDDSNEQISDGIRPNAGLEIKRTYMLSASKIRVPVGHLNCSMCNHIFDDLSENEVEQGKVFINKFCRP